MEGKSKVQDLVSENCSLKSYFSEKSLSATRDIFRIRTNMNKLKGNFRHDKRNADVRCVASDLKQPVQQYLLTQIVCVTRVWPPDHF